jgi:hypothetical protein
MQGKAKLPTKVFSPLDSIWPIMPHLPLKYLKIFLIVGGWYEIQYTKQGHLYMNEIGGFLFSMRVVAYYYILELKCRATYPRTMTTKVCSRTGYKFSNCRTSTSITSTCWSTWLKLLAIVLLFYISDAIAVQFSFQPMTSNSQPWNISWLEMKESILVVTFGPIIIPLSFCFFSELALRITELRNLDHFDLLIHIWCRE